MYGCTKLEDELKQQLFSTEKQGFNFMIERYAGILNRMLLSMTFSNNPHDYLRLKYAVHLQNLKTSAAQTLSFYERQ